MAGRDSPELLEFEAATPFGLTVRCTRRYWAYLVEWKHPTLAGRAVDVAQALVRPEHVRRSRTDPAVLLFYRRYETRWLCAVVRIVADGAFLVTAYPTDALKAGEIVWTAFE
jgi:hypothetical protein